MGVILHRRIQKDLRAALAFYETEGDIKSADRFFAEAEDAVVRVRRYPHGFHFIEKGRRRVGSTNTSSNMASSRNLRRIWTGIQFDRFPRNWESWFMKTTVEIDDELYREAEAHASLTGQKIKDLVTEGLRLALRAGARANVSAAASRELAACFAEADTLMKAAPRGPTAREHLSKGRKRLEKA